MLRKSSSLIPMLQVLLMVLIKPL